MKVGDYVRTKYGIAKYISYKVTKYSMYYVVDKDIMTCNVEGWENCVSGGNEIIKSSPNIIELIEVGDYVNGQKVFDKLYDELNKCWYLKLEIGEVFGKYARTYQQHIKSIVTKEQFESMQYNLESQV